MAEPVGLNTKFDLCEIDFGQESDFSGRGRKALTDAVKAFLVTPNQAPDITRA